MQSTTESSAITRFIHSQSPPIQTAEHGVETQVVRRPLPPSRPSRRRWRGPLIAAAVVALGTILLVWAAPWDEPDPAAQSSAAPAVTAPTPDPGSSPVAPAAAAAAAPSKEEASEPVVIAMPDDEQADEAVPTSGDPADYEVDLGDDLTPTDEIALQLLAELNNGDDSGAAADVHAATPKLHRRAARRSPRARRNASAELPTLAHRKGVLMINSKPPCRIVINNVDTGLTTPQRAIRLTGGRHKVTLVNREYNIHSSLTVNIHPGKRVRVVRDLTEHIARQRHRSRRARH